MDLEESVITKAKYQLLSSDHQMSEAFCNSAFLALSGGFQDAYTYFTRDKVFSNAQTGNVVLMSQHMFMGEWQQGLHYLLPLLAFGLGVMIAELIQKNYKYSKGIHWRQRVLLVEIIILFLVGFLSGEYNILATILVSFSCAMQVQTFRKVNGYSYASTMCIGNLRSGMSAFTDYITGKNKKCLQQALYYFAVILIFAIGAGLGGNLSIRYGVHTIWFSCLFLLVSFMLMTIEKIR